MSEQAAASCATVEPSAQLIAEAVRDVMTVRDRVYQTMGMSVSRIAPGSATLSMTVRTDMLNGHDSCHGGLIATLADTAFAYACNSRNVTTVASSFSIDLLLPAHGGDQLHASCHELHGGGRMGVYDCEVLNQNGQRIAVFRGHSYSIKGRAVVDSLPMPASRG